jgi:nitrite reductase/ring-hydroxylating ferredoxin subunit
MSEVDCEACDGCHRDDQGGGRREFVARLISTATLALAGVGASPAELLGASVAAVDSERAGANQRAFPIPASDGVTIDRKSQAIIVRYRNKAYAFALSCPHENTALKWLQKDARFQCPKHGSRYQPDGTFMEGRATRNMDRFAVAKDNTTLVVNLGKWFQSDKDPAGWSAAFVQL